MMSIQSVQPKFGWDGFNLPVSTPTDEGTKKVEDKLMAVSTLFDEKQTVETLLPWVKRFAMEYALSGNDARQDTKNATANLLENGGNLPGAFRERLIDLTA